VGADSKKLQFVTAHFSEAFACAASRPTPAGSVVIFKAVIELLGRGRGNIELGQLPSKEGVFGKFRDQLPKLFAGHFRFFLAQGG